MGNELNREAKAEDFEDTDLIFIAGGTNSSFDVSRKLLVYSVATQKWFTRLPLMKQPRTGCGVTMLDKNVYVAGGCTAKSLHVSYLQGTSHNSKKQMPRRLLKNVERFNAELGVWIEYDVPEMMKPREQFGLELMDRCLYAVGDGCERYDPRTRRWESFGEMDCQRSGCCISVLNNKLYAAGGWTGNSVHSSVECYEPRMDRWYFTASMSSRRRNFGMTPVGNSYLLATGGQTQFEDFAKHPIPKCEIYDCARDRWVPFSRLPHGRSYHGTVCVDGGIYNLGGSQDGYKVFLKSMSDDVEKYSVSKRKWKNIFEIPFGVCGHGVEAFSNSGLDSERQIELELHLMFRVDNYCQVNADERRPMDFDGGECWFNCRTGMDE